MPRRRHPHGQATVELVALLPALVVLVLAAAQVVAAAHAWSLAGGAARAGARAAEVGAPFEAAARAVLPAGHAARARVVATGDGRRVRVALRVPRVLPFVPQATVAAEAPLIGERR